MIRADWTPLWAADWSNRRALGPKQVACLELLRDHGPLTHKELLAAGFGLPVRDSLTISGYCYPPLAGFTTGEHPQRYFLAAPDRQQELDVVLAAIRDGREPPPYDQMSYRGAVEEHIYRAGIARQDTHGRWFLIPPADQQANMAPWARKIARAMVVAPQTGAAA